MALQLVGNKLTEDDIELLKLAEERKGLYKCIKDENLDQQERQDLFKKYQVINRKIKDIAYTSAGIFDDARFGHLRKGSELNLGLLKEWRSRKMAEQKKEELKRKKENEEKESKKEPESLSSLMAKLEDILKEKELAVFTKIHSKGKKHEVIADELDITKKYSYCLLSEARRKIKEWYDLDKVAEILEETNVSSSEFEELKKDQEATPEEQPREDDQDKPKGIFINFDDEATEGDVDEITGLITRIQGVSHISENNPKVEELKSKISSLMNKF